MDQRWRADHDAATNRIDREPNSGAPYFAPASFRQPHGSETPYDYQPVYRVAAPATIDVRGLHHEIARLRKLLSDTQTSAKSSVRAAAQHSARLNEQVETLQQQLRELREASAAKQQNRDQELQSLRTKLADAQQATLAKAGQVTVLKRELENVAIAASAEQKQLEDRHASVTGRLQAAVVEQQSTIESLRSQIDEYDESLTLWQIAQQQAVALCEWYELECRVERDELELLRSEYDRFRAGASEAFALCDDEIDTLEATVGILRTDHEMVELINADLDLLNDQLQAKLDDLQGELDALVAKSAGDREESIRAIDMLGQQLHTTHSRLNAVSEENRSLVQSVAKLKSAQDDFDASMFAKDQEIGATKKLAEETRKQLDQLRREHAVMAGQNDDMRNRIREQAGNVARLESELADASQQAAQATAIVAERDRQMREIQSAARAAEANAMLRANEAEQQYAIELERLETALQRKQESETLQSQSQANDQARIDELEQQLTADRQAAKTAAAASAAENDRLQQIIDQQHLRLGDNLATLDAKDARIELLEESVAELQTELAGNTNQTSQLRLELDQRRNQLSEYADRVATQQQSLALQEQELVALKAQLEEQERVEPSTSIDQLRTQLHEEISAQWSERVAELEQNQLTMRERHHQAQIAQQRTIDSLSQTAVELTAERDVVSARVTELIEQNSEMATRLQDLSRFANPINEAKRLSQELARQAAQHAQQRATLLARIEQLQQSAASRRAA